MKLLYSIIFLVFTNILFAQDTLKNNFPTYFISQIELRYELIDLGKINSDPPYFGKNYTFDLHQTIKPFSPKEFPPYFDLELSEEDIFVFQSGFEIEGIKFFKVVENNHKIPTSKNHYFKGTLVYTTNFDEKESVNFYQQLINQNTLRGKNYLSFSNVIYQREKFLRSFLEWNYLIGKRSFHINIAYNNNLQYEDLDLTSIGYGDQYFINFPEAYHEKRNGEWGHLLETQNLYFSEIDFFTKVLFSPFKKTYLKFDSDLRYFFLSSENRERQRFYALGIGVKPTEGTIFFLEYTNRAIISPITSFAFTTNLDPYFALNAKQTLKCRLFKR